MANILTDDLVSASHNHVGEFHTPTGVAGFIVMNSLDFVYVWDDTQVNPAKLQASLSRILNVYPAVAGRVAHENRSQMRADGLETHKVICNNHGVRFQVIEANRRFEKAIEKTRGDLVIFPCINKIIQGEHPLLTVKLTIFREGGCSLGLVANHILFDGWTFAMFMKDWSAVHDGIDVEPVCSIPQRDLFKSLSTEEAEELVHVRGFGGAELKMSRWMSQLGSDCGILKQCCRWLFSRVIRAPQKQTILHFSAEELNIMKHTSQTAAGTWMSTNEALLAHLHPLMIDAFGVTQEMCSEVSVNVVANLRGTADISLRTIGNAISVSQCRYSLKDMSDASLFTLIVHESMRAAVAQPAVAKSLHAANALGFCPICPSLPPGSIAQWNYQAAAPFYNVDFGAGKPSYSLPWGAGPTINIMPGVRGGVDVMTGQMPGAGLSTWVRRRHQIPRKCLQVVTLAVSIHASCRWKHATWSSTLAQCAMVVILKGAITALDKKHDRRVQSCFAALENHRNLHVFGLPKSFTQMVQKPLQEIRSSR